MENMLKPIIDKVLDDKNDPCNSWSAYNSWSALAYWERAADKDHLKAQIKVGCCYFEGIGAKTNLSKSVHYFSRAAEKGDEDVQLKLELCRKSLFDFNMAAVGKGDALCIWKIADFYERGEGVEKSLESAFHYYLLAAEKGDTRAYSKIAIMYEEGKGIEKCMEKSFNYYVMDMKTNDSKSSYDSCLKVAGMFSRGEGVEKCAYKAYCAWFKSCRYPYPHNLNGDYYHVGLCYLNGEGVKVSKEEGFKWLLRAASKTCRYQYEASYLVGDCYSKGEGVEMSMKKASIWLCKAYNSGYGVQRAREHVAYNYYE